MPLNNEFCLLLNSHAEVALPFRDARSISLKNGTLYLKKGSRCCEAESASSTSYLIGTIYNRAFLNELAGLWSPYSCVLNDAELLVLLHERLGKNAFSLAEGNFCLLTDNHRSGLAVVTECRGFCSVHVVQARNAWVTNTLKSVSAAEGEDALRFECEQKVIASALRSDTYTPVINAWRLKPGTINLLSQDSQGYLTNEMYAALTIPDDQIVDLPQKKLFELIDHYMRSPLQTLAQRHIPVGIPLSGGLDSSLVTALACHAFDKVHTYSIGSESSNEFEYAQQVAEALGTRHQTKILSEQDVMTGILEAIYFNEIFDGLSAEIQSGLFNVYRLAQGEVGTLLTGYGSDLLFGGILTPGASSNDPNRILAEQVYRTRWTGEFSTCGASRYGIDIRHPFWTQPLIALCHNLNPYHKTRNNEVKNILREYAASLQLLPEAIVWRKKIGIHEGSAVNQTFADILGSGRDNYQRKTRFSYRVYQAFLRMETDINDMTHQRLIAMMKGD